MPESAAKSLVNRHSQPVRIGYGPWFWSDFKLTHYLLADDLVTTGATAAACATALRAAGATGVELVAPCRA